MFCSSVCQAGFFGSQGSVQVSLHSTSKLPKQTCTVEPQSTFIFLRSCKPYTTNWSPACGSCNPAGGSLATVEVKDERRKIGILHRVESHRFCHVGLLPCIPFYA